MISEEELIWTAYITEAVVPFDKRRQIRKGMAKKHGRGILKPYTFGFDVEFTIPVDMEAVESFFDHNEYIFVGDDGYDAYVKQHMDSQGIEEPEYEDIGSWEYDNDEPDVDDYYYKHNVHNSDMSEEEYNNAKDVAEQEHATAHHAWTELKTEIEEQLSKYEEAQLLYDELYGSYVKHILSNGDWKLYYNILKGHIDSEINYVREEIRDYISTNWSEEYDAEDLGGWDVDEDEVRNIEIASPILTTSDIPMVNGVLDIINTVGDATKSTSAHIHIGVPDTFSYFDLLALYDLIDEEHILKLQPSRDRTYAKLKDVMFNKIYNLVREYEKGSSIDVDKFATIDCERYMGVNISNVGRSINRTTKSGEKTSTGTGKTVEFRYLSSEILDNSNEEFFEWIDYYMLIMKLAQTRNQIKFKPSTGSDTIILTRISNDAIKYDINKSTMPYEKPSEIKQTKSRAPLRESLVKLHNQIYDQSTTNDFQAKYKRPDFNNMTKHDIEQWWVSTPHHAYQYIINMPSKTTYTPEKKFIDRAMDNITVGVSVLNRAGTRIIFPLRIPKLERKLSELELDTTYNKELYEFGVFQYATRMKSTTHNQHIFEAAVEFIKMVDSIPTEELRQQFEKLLSTLNKIAKDSSAKS